MDLFLIEYLYLALLVFAFNIAPAFAPPTWSVLVLFELNFDLNPVLLVACGALAAGSGRYCLGRATGALRSYLAPDVRENLLAASEILNKRRTSHIFGLALFALSPLPSAQLFEAAGLIGMRLIPLTLAFFSGRLVSYSLYVAGASSLKATNLGDLIKDNLTSPLGIALQLLLIYGVYLLTRIDWRRYQKKLEG
jgi:uncharacterized membrane protein YdjX (TVP38/TMEM64 family)